MLDEVLRHKRPIAAIVVVVGWLWIILFPIWIDYLKRFPIDEPFSVVKAETIERTINIRVNGSYHLALQGYVEPSVIQRSELRGKELSMSVDWFIESTDGRTSYNGRGEPVGKISLYLNQVMMDISADKLYPKGEYRFSARLSKPAWDLTDIDWHIVLRRKGGKIIQDWRDSVAMTGLLLHPFIRIGVILLSVYLLWEIVRSKLGRS